MRARVRHRLVILLAAATAALLAAGCGGGGDSSSDPASVVPAGSPVFVEASLRPGGSAQEDLDSLAQTILGVDDLGDFIVEELDEAAADSGSPFDYAEDVEPWLGEKAGLWLGDYDGDDFNAAAFALQSTDTGATEDFIDKFTKAEDGEEEAEDASYEGVDYKLDPEDGEVVGIVDDLFVFTGNEADFKAMVDAADGDSLADEELYADAVAGAPSGSVADVYVDIGSLIAESGSSIDAETELFLESSGLEPEEATAVASVVPGSEQIEIDLSTDVTGDQPAGGDASETLASLPASSVFAFATAELGERFGEAIDNLDAKGIPDAVPPHQLKKTLAAETGIDLDKLAASFGDVGVFVEGNSERNLTGALVMDTESGGEAKRTVSNIGLLLRSSGTPGVTAIGGTATGFSIRSPELGRRPLVVAAEDERLVIGYGLATAKAALAGTSGRALGDDPVYEEAVAALGGTPISAYADGPRAVRLVSNLVPADDIGFAEALPYLRKLDFLALGSGSDGDRTTAKLIVGIAK